MTRINQKEYWFLKRLDDKWKWIARDRDSLLYVFNTKPGKGKIYAVWSIEDGKDHDYWEIENKDLFQFIQWEDEEPHNISELIEEYEEREFYNYVGWGYYKREGAEVKKLKEIRSDFENKLIQTLKGEDPMLKIEVLNIVSDLFRQLDEPKITEKQAYNKIAESFPASAEEIESVLEKYYSSMFIEFSEELQRSITRAFDVETISKKIEALTGMTVEQIEEVARNGGIMSKQELSTIPSYVVDWISDHCEQFDLYPALKRLENNVLSWHDVYKWYRGNTRKFVNAYLTEKYKTKEETKKYVIKLDSKVYLQRYEIDNKNIVTPFRIVAYSKEVAIKFDDRRKAEKVAELVEGKVEELE